MAPRNLKVWFDREADFLEVTFEEREGFFRQTANDHVMEKVDRPAISTCATDSMAVGRRMPARRP